MFTQGFRNAWAPVSLTSCFLWSPGQRPEVMKITSMLVVLLMGFVAIHGFEDVIITCSEQWLWVRIKWRVLGNHPEPQPSQLYLGTHCAATGRLMNYFEYFHPLSHCGIKTEVCSRVFSLKVQSFMNQQIQMFMVPYQYRALFRQCLD